MTIERRGFVGRALLGVLPFLGASAPIGRPATDERSLGPIEPWLDGLTGRHRQFMDVAANNQGAPLGRTANFLNQYGQAYGLKDSDLNAIFCAHGTAIIMVLNDAVWAQYRLGAQYSINDPQTKSPAVRNIFSGTGASPVPSVAELQKRGVRFIACMQSISRMSRELAARDSGEAALIGQALLAGLLPGVTPVPAAIVAANRAQESGLTYAYLG